MSAQKSNHAVCCSAPGKVLMTGGYLILERPNAGLVLTVNARFYSVVEPFSAKGVHTKSTISSAGITDHSHLIEVVSPQFVHSELYRVTTNPTFGLTPLSPNHQSNPYTEKTIINSLLVISGIVSKENVESLLAQGITITIVGDNDFYSQRDQLIHRNLALSSSSLLSLPRFLVANTAGLKEMKKTGLGSSATLVTSLVGALLQYFGAVRIPTRDQYTAKSRLEMTAHASGKSKKSKSESSSSATSSSTLSSDLFLVHNLAQYCHCLAQGKIGSGFDVSSAVFGSHQYVRFSGSILAPLLSVKTQPTSSEVLKVLRSQWDNEVTPFALPTGMRLVLGDVSKGSNTPNMVSKILKWKQASPDAPSLWQNLAMCNDEVAHFFEMLQKCSEDQELEIYMQSLEKCAHVTADQWTDVTSNPVAQNLFKLRSAFLKIRSYLRTMGKQADVEVEPPSQEELINETMEIPGVLISGVPGAGGYDAIFAVLINPAALKTVEELWIKKGVLPLILKEESEGLFVDSLPQPSSL